MDTSHDDALKYVGQLQHIFSRIPILFEYFENELEFRNEEFNDICHALEKLTFGGSQGYKLAMALKENRIKRREAKNAIEKYRPLYDLVQKYKGIHGDIRKAMSMINQTENLQKAQVYKLRHPDSEVVAMFQGLSEKGCM